MGVLTESALSAELKAGNLRRVYFLYGEEDFLIKTYADRIIAAAVPEDARDMNFLKYSKAPKADELSDQLENMPFFADYKCVLIEDLEADALDEGEFKAYLSTIANIPDTSVLIFAQKNIPVEQKKGKSKKDDAKSDKKKKGEANLKKLMTACQNHEYGAVCEFSRMTPAKLADMTARKFARAGCSISREDAAFLAEECGSSLTVLQMEIEKLCAYKGGGEDRVISRADIEKLVPRRIDTNIYNLAKELFAGRTGSALHILDDLFIQRVGPTDICGAMSGHFTDLYRAKLAIQAKKSSADAAKAFGYYGRAFVMDNAFRSVRPLSAEYLGGCIEILYRTDRLLKSSKADGRILLERAIAEIAALNKGKH